MQYANLRVVTNDQGNYVVLNKNGSAGVFDDSGREVERHSLAIGAIMSVADGGRVKKGQSFIEWDPYSVPILAEKPGTVNFHGFIENVTVKKEVDQSTGLIWERLFWNIKKISIRKSSSSTRVPVRRLRLTISRRVLT